MVKCMKKCRRFAKVAVMEVTQVVGMRTRARSIALAAAPVEKRVSRKRKAGRSKGEDGQMAYLKLRSRSLVMTHRERSKLALNSDGRIGNGERVISRCSSSSSCQAAEEDVNILFPAVRVHMPCEDVAASSMCQIEYSRDRFLEFIPVCPTFQFRVNENSQPFFLYRSEASSSSNQIIYSGELESSTERKSRHSTPEFRMPSAAEIEEFFTAAEESEKQRFVTRYNFDVENEVPLEGRYEWVRINPSNHVVRLRED